MKHDSPNTECPQCSELSISTTEVEHTFPFGIGEQQVELSVMVPLRTCTSCGFEFLDEVAEDLKHDATCHHLGLLTPSEIRAIRKQYGLKRHEFAAVTGLGEATIGRWESGAIYQSSANDNFLRLLRDPRNMLELQRRAEPS